MFIALLFIIIKIWKQPHKGTMMSEQKLLYRYIRNIIQLEEKMKSCLLL